MIYLTNFKSLNYVTESLFFFICDLILLQQTNKLSWQESSNTINFPNAKSNYEVILEIFEDTSSMMSTRKISLRSELPTINLTEYLSPLPPHTKFSVNLWSRTSWALSRQSQKTYFYTQGIPASPPEHFRVFWSPVEKGQNYLLILDHNVNKSKLKNGPYQIKLIIFLGYCL